MKQNVIRFKIKYLQLNYKWFSFLHFVTNKKHYFDKKIKIGIIILSLITILNSCKNESYINKTRFVNKSNFNSRKVIPLIELVAEDYYFDEKLVNEDIDTVDFGSIVSCYVYIVDTYESAEFENLRKFIADNIKYPQEAIENNIQGTVYVRFVINKIGKVEKVTLLRSVEKNLDSEAVRVISLLPEFRPLRQNGQSAVAFFTIPIKFQLQ